MKSKNGWLLILYFVERLIQLSGKDFSQTFDVDYEETFASFAKINSILILLSCATNLG